MTLHFAIDYDDTITAAPAFFSEFIRRGEELGHRFYLVTARRNTEENAEMINSFLDTHVCQMPIIFCNLRAKRQVMDERGLRVDIWIDDNPRTIVEAF